MSSFRSRDATMTPAFSVYLDLVRATAALLVLFYHAATNIELGGAWLRPAFAHTGTPGVIIFFVLSGFVITWASDTKEKTSQGLLHQSPGAAVVGRDPGVRGDPYLPTRSASPSIRSSIRRSRTGRRCLARPFSHLAMSGVFLNQIWFLDVRPLSNNPFWSLSYEWWYYAAFGFFMLIPGRIGSLLALAALAVMGPKIWLLFPIWLMGVFVYRRLQVRREIPVAVAVADVSCAAGRRRRVSRSIGCCTCASISKRWSIRTTIAFSIIFIPAILFGALVAIESLCVSLARALSRARSCCDRAAGALGRGRDALDLSVSLSAAVLFWRGVPRRTGVAVLDQRGDRRLHAGRLLCAERGHRGQEARRARLDRSRVVVCGAGRAGEDCGAGGVEAPFRHPEVRA